MNWKALLLAGFVSVSFVGCDNDDGSDDDSSDMSRSAVENTAESGTWEITKFIDSGKNETDDYAGYEFTFGSSDDLTATNGSNTINGTWNVTGDNSNDDDNGDDLDFVISFSSPQNFKELSDDWDIKDRTSSKIELKDVSGGDGDVDELTFKKQ